MFLGLFSLDFDLVLKPCMKPDCKYRINAITEISVGHTPSLLFFSRWNNVTFSTNQLYPRWIFNQSKCINPNICTIANALWAVKSNRNSQRNELYPIRFSLQQVSFQRESTCKQQVFLHRIVASST
ncbi:unnamed protein product [Albugo candida]|uniref:Uncharacterized protein n=1 Tax=Albugo candida TaxID=65357 RepID=A0A024G1D7_9STRA|nr:unnamed protein product [Albugo candida]|eukprot:CCI40356.1 unnamed protein product [Albugo candida]